MTSLPTRAGTSSCYCSPTCPPIAATIAERVAEDLLAALRPPFTVAGQPVGVAASIGTSAAPAGADTLEQLLQHADAAMYTAQRSAGSSWSRHGTEA